MTLLSPSPTSLPVSPMPTARPVQSTSQNPKSKIPDPPTPDPRPPIPARAWLLRIAGTLFFAGLLVWLDLTGKLQVGEILSALRGANPVLVALSIALYVPFLVVKAARWRMVSADIRIPTRWGSAWR